MNRTAIFESNIEDDIARVRTGLVAEYRTVAMELVWRCQRCGYLLARAFALPERCPVCNGQREGFVAITED